MKSNWYHSRKKLELQSLETKFMIGLSALYIALITGLLIWTLMSPDYVNKLILNHISKNPGTTNQQAYTVVKFTHILKYLGAVGIALAFLFTAYWGRRKLMYGYLFPVFWMLLWAGLLGTHIYLLTTTTEMKIFNVIILLPIFANISVLIYFFIRLKKYRERLGFAYVQRIRIGKERML